MRYRSPLHQVQQRASASAGVWLLYAFALFAVLSLVRVLAYWTIAHYGLLGARMDNLHPTLISALSDALDTYSLELTLRSLFVLPALLVLLPLAQRLRRGTFVLVSCALMVVATAPMIVLEYAPASFHAFGFAVAIAVAVSLPSRRSVTASPPLAQTGR